jgi:N6-L-threonylcarbamoyladenine synthase
MPPKRPLKILAIESSCDETACAVVEDGRRVLSSVIASQIEIHKLTGGVVPEVAAREHVLKVRGVVEEAVEKASAAIKAQGGAGLRMEDIDAIAATRGPGLLSSLVIGYAAAATLARVLNKPFIPVHHVAGHIYANWLDLAAEDRIEFPVVVLTVSGGHNELVLMRGEEQFELLGETRDDAAGEAFDKVARLLGLGYPGGPAIGRAAVEGNPRAIAFPRAMLSAKNFDFSFSGLKTAVLREVEEYLGQRSGDSHDQLDGSEGERDHRFVVDCAASFQECVCDILSEKLIRAAKKFGAREIHLAGGVSANQRLREMTTEKIAALPAGTRLRYSKNLHYCTDNAAMIGAAAYYQYINSPNQRREFPPRPQVFPEPQLDLYQQTQDFHQKPCSKN